MTAVGGPQYTHEHLMKMPLDELRRLAKRVLGGSAPQGGFSRLSRRDAVNLIEMNTPRR